MHLYFYKNSNETTSAVQKEKKKNMLKSILMRWLMSNPKKNATTGHNG